MSEEPKSSTKYVMVESSPSADEDEIDLFEFIRILIQTWKPIVGITLVCTSISVIYALFFAPESFKAETLLVPAKEEKSAASSALSQFGGLAAMAGISIPSSSNVERVLATLETRRFLKEFISRRNLLPIIFEESWDKSSESWKLAKGQEELKAEDGIGYLQSAIEVEQEKSGLIKLSIFWKDAGIAAQLANELVEQLNEQLQQKAIADSKKRVGYLEQELAKTTLQDMRAVLYSLLESEKRKAMLANVNEDFALEVIDPAVTPEICAKPDRKLIIVLGGVCGLLIGFAFVFIGHFLKRLRTLNTSKPLDL